MSDNEFTIDTNRFNLDSVQYRVFKQLDPNTPDFIIPLHDICLGLVDRYIQARNEDPYNNSSRATLETFYDSLCRQGAKHDTGKLLSSGLKRGGIGGTGLEWEHDYYGARQIQGYYSWKGGHGQEARNLLGLQSSLTLTDK